VQVPDFVLHFIPSLYLYFDWSSGRKDKIDPAHAMKTQAVVEVHNSNN
jgi:hypothetical protein